MPFDGQYSSLYSFTSIYSNVIHTSTPRIRAKCRPKQKTTPKGGFLCC